MKKNLICLILLVLSFSAFIGYKQYKKATDDTIPPKIICNQEVIYASVEDLKDSGKALLEGVRAEDNRSGDVSDTLVVQDISNFINEKERVITFAAIDDNLNVGTLQRTLVLTDYSEPEFDLKKPLSFVINSKVDFLGNIIAKSSVDGNLTRNIRYSISGMVDNMMPGYYPIEYFVTDSCGKTTYFNTEIEIYDSVYSSITVTLKDYLIYIPQGSEFNPIEYYGSNNIEGKRTISGEVDTNTPGTYYVDYFVHGENAAGKSRLTVIVVPESEG